MSTVKISQLPALNSLNANTDLTIFLALDLPSDITGKFTATSLARGLYSNNTLIVGNYTSLLPNTIAQFSLAGESYVQTNLVNTNDGGTADIVITANTGSGGSDSTNFIDMGWANKNYQPGFEFNNIGTAVRPNDGYLYTQGSANNNYGNLIIGTTSTNTSLKFIVGGGSSANIVATMTSKGLVLNTQSYLVFGDGTIQTTAALPSSYETAAYAQANSANVLAQSAYNQANTSSANTVYITGGLNSANANISYILAYGLSANANASALNVYTQQVYAYANAVNTYAVSAYAFANTAVQNTAVIQLQTVSLSGNLIANTPGQSIFVDRFTSNSATFNQNLVVLGNLTANTIIANTFVYGSATANGMVTQLTSKSTTVTSNGITGQITTHNAALAGQAYVTFTVNNSYVKHTNDIIIVNVQNSVTTPNPYLVGVSNVSVGSFNVTVYNADSGGGSSHSDAIVLNYAVMRVGN